MASAPQLQLKHACSEWDGPNWQGTPVLDLLITQLIPTYFLIGNYLTSLFIIILLMF